VTASGAEPVEAEARVAAFEDMLARLPTQAFVATTLPPPGAELDAARGEATRLAADHGLADLLAAARADVRAAVLRRYDEGGYRPTMAGLNWGVSEGRAEDRVTAVVAAEDAVTAAVVEPWASPDLLATLASPFELIERGQDVGPSFDLSEATARRTAPLRGSAALGQVVIGLAILVAVVAALAIGSWAIAGLLVIAAVVAAGVLVGSRRGD
jgi:hypothetical protein